MKNTKKEKIFIDQTIYDKKNEMSISKHIKFYHLSNYLIHDIMTKTRKKSFTYTNTTGESYLFATQRKNNIHTAYYLLLDNNEEKKFPILTSKILDKLLKESSLTTYDKVVIYAAANWINKEKKEKYKIKFMQIPYELPLSKYENLYSTAWDLASQNKISEALKYIYKAYQVISRAVYTSSYSNLADETIFKLKEVQEFKDHLEEIHKKINESKKTNLNKSWRI